MTDKRMLKHADILVGQLLDDLLDLLHRYRVNAGKGFVLDGLPEEFPLLEPVTDVSLGQVVVEPVALLPAKILPHLQQVDAQRVVAGVPRIGNMAIALDGGQEWLQFVLHGGL